MSQLSRAEKAGRRCGIAIYEMVNLMYQKNTTKNFWTGFHDGLLLGDYRKNICWKCKRVIDCTHINVSQKTCEEAIL